MLAQILPRRFIPLILALTFIAGMSSNAFAQDQRPEVEVDTSILDDLGPPRSVPPVTLIKPGHQAAGRILTVPSEPPVEKAEEPFVPLRVVPPPGTISHPPEEIAVTPTLQILTPEPTPVPLARKPAPEKIVKAPVPEQKPEPKAKAATAQKFPITEKLHTDSIDPAAPETAPAPSPDIAAALSPGVPPPARMPPASRSQPKNASEKAMKLSGTASKIVKSEIKSKPKKIVTKVVGSPQTKSPATPAMPAIPAAPVTASVLSDDKLARNLTAPDRHKLAQEIDAKNSQIEKIAPVPAAPKPDVTQNVNPEIVHTPAENVNSSSAQTASISPDNSKHSPRPPPLNPKEVNFFTVPCIAGVDGLDAKVTSVLQAQVLPLLKDHPSWKLQIQSFASPTDNEPISARKVSLARALAVRSWLLDKGIEPRRMEVRALGLETDREPPDRVDMVLIDPEAMGG